jgi:YHS domain-containing protein
MAERDERLKRYDALGDRLTETIIRPRMDRLKMCLEQLNSAQIESTRHTCRLLFRHSPEFPAAAKVELGVTRDGQARRVWIQYNASLLPLLMPFDGNDQLSMPLEGLDEAKVAAWIDEKLLQFVNAYLSLETTNQYHAENLATDPVCGMSVNKASAPARMDYQGVTYFFCIDDCRRRFAENPGRYLTPGKTAAEPP